MKLFSFTITLVALLLPAILFAQAPLKINYQAVARDVDGDVIANQNIAIRASILEGSTTGPEGLVETHTAITNDFGLFNIQVGGGTVVSGTGVTWNAHEYFLKIELDLAGGMNYALMGVSQLVSVPYAMHANTAENAINDAVNDADADPTNEIELPAGGTEGQTLKIVSGQLTWVSEGCDLAIGDTYQGGIIFYLDESGCHGLACAPTDQSTDSPYEPNTGEIYSHTGATGDGLGAGRLNTALAIAPYNSAISNVWAAHLCGEYSVTSGDNLYGDWYLPSSYELNLMYQNVGQGDALGLGNVANFSFGLYWSSTEDDFFVNKAWRQYFATGQQDSYWKTFGQHVRAVRAF